MRKLSLALALVAVLAFAGSAAAAESILVGTTTSTADTGLLDYLAPKILKDTGLDMRWIAVGTGKALEHGKNCDVDILMVHAPGAEKKFIAEGHGVSRTEFMFNDFVLVGPAKDPAKIKGRNAADSLKAVAAAGATFASRGDDSGTDKLEKGLWKHAGLAVPDKAAWYMQVGQGMMVTLRMAAERGAYTITDRGTWIAYDAKEHGKSGLVILSEGDMTFLGFLPRQKGQTKKLLARHAATGASLVFFERKDRLHATLALAAEVLGDREFAICRELTKQYEEFILGRLGGLAAAPLDVLGEVTVVIGPEALGGGVCLPQNAEADPAHSDPLALLDAVLAQERARGGKPKEIARRAAGRLGGALTAKEIYERMTRHE